MLWQSAACVKQTTAPLLRVFLAGERATR